jgi:hypothetical protein
VIILQNQMYGLNRNRKSQAIAELAILGAIIITLLATLVSYAFSYSQRQSLEMYTFRKALELSRKTGIERKVDLTVIRYIFEPSFFSGLKKQMRQSSASLDTNTKYLYIANEAQDTGSMSLVQIGEAMINAEKTIKFPSVYIRVRTYGEKNNPDSIDEKKVDVWQSAGNFVKEYKTEGIEDTGDYRDVIKIQDSPAGRTATKNMMSHDIKTFIVEFMKPEEIALSFFKSDPFVDLPSEENLGAYANVNEYIKNEVVSMETSKQKETNDDLLIVTRQVPPDPENDLATWQVEIKPSTVPGNLKVEVDETATRNRVLSPVVQ